MEITVKQKSKNKFGQYFTPEIVADFMIDLADIKSESSVLEPSCGEGIFLKLLYQRGFTNVTAYEIDDSLATEYECVKYQSFIQSDTFNKYDLIIGNPPYIRWANLEVELKDELLYNELWNRYFNSLCDYLYIFILKSIEQLNDNGQLIFICPEYWLNTTHSLTLRNYMVSKGYFEKIYHFNETPIFDKVTISSIIFKFIKSDQKVEKIEVAKFYANQKLTTETLCKLKNKEQSSEIEYFTISQFQIDERWLLAPDTVKKALKIFETKCRNRFFLQKLSLFDTPSALNYHTIGDFCDIGNGLVSGLDKAFQINHDALSGKEKEAILKVIKAKDLKPFYYENITNYMLVNDLDSEEVFYEQYPNFYQCLQPFIADLNKRYQYNRKINYWEWVFLRNFNLFSKPVQRIFVPCKERISNKNHFRFALVESGIFPTQDVTAIFKKEKTQESIEYLLAFLNNHRVFDWLKCNGIVKGNIVEFSEKPISSIPFRAINWNDSDEIVLHNKITHLTQLYIKEKNEDILLSINEAFDNLF
jgi:adenine-specific DNA-methyltransferase